MKDWRQTLVSKDARILDAIQVLDKASYQICLVVDPANRLIGTVTDGDIRRGILAGIEMSAPVSKIMNVKPRTAFPGGDSSALIALMRQHLIHQMPLLNAEGVVVGLAQLDELIGQSARRDNIVVLMAGGLGQRLRPLTEDTPKPLLQVGGRPILERILDGLIAQGFWRFFLSVNYRADMIEEHFGDGSRWGVEIRYLREDKPMGTAGPLGLLPKHPSAPVLVMNGDLLTQTNLPRLLEYHQQRRAQASMCVRKYDFQVPFGVVHLDGDEITGIDEKPVHEFFVNAGIYTLDPAIIDLVPRNQRLDMPELFTRARNQGLRTVVFPIHEYWLDIGRLDDFEKANHELTEQSGKWE